MAMDSTGLTAVRQEMILVRIPIQTDQFKRDILQEVVSGEPAELVRVVVPIEDTQASFISCVHLPCSTCHTSFA